MEEPSLDLLGRSPRLNSDTQQCQVCLCSMFWLRRETEAGKGDVLCPGDAQQVRDASQV